MTGTTFRYTSTGAVHSGSVSPPTPEDLIADLVNTVIAFNLQQGVSNALDSKVDNILKALEDTNTHNDVSAINVLYSFIYSVEAQRGVHITDEQADTLTADAQEIIDMLSE